MELASLQAYMNDQRIDGWLLYDFRGSNPVFARMMPPLGHTTRRAFLWIPARGAARLLCSRIDRPAFAAAPMDQDHYTSWREMQTWLAGRVSSGARIAMEYSPGNALPAVAYVDAGTVELIRGLGGEVVSSANLVQVGAARWSASAAQAHAVASKAVAEIKDAAFGLIAERLAAGARVTEHDVQRFILQRFDEAGLQYPDPPIVAANAHSGDPHFEVSADNPAEIRKGDWLLIDLWARVPGNENIYSDITWVGFAGRSVPAAHARVFGVVKQARDAALELARSAGGGDRRICGWELDEAAMRVIRDAGLSEGIRHRTGHSLSPGALVHGIGMNLDNLETHDTRELLPGVGFTIEPGVYLPEFGVRLEINVHYDPAAGPTVTSCVQDDVLLLA